MKKIFAAVGVSDFKTYIEKYFLPIFLLAFLILFVFIFAFNNVYYKLVGVFLFFTLLSSLFFYPMLILDKQSRRIEETLHYFITYAGAISTINSDRKDFFRDLSEKTRYNEIARVFKKILYLVENIKLDFSTSCYKVASIINSKHFSKFLERMGIALSFNSELSRFFMDEQRAVMDSYRIVYTEGLERIKLVDELFVSVILAFAFLLSTVMLLPFMTGISSAFFLRFGIIFIIFLDIGIYVFVGYFLPKDKIYHDLGYDEGRKKVLVSFFVALFFSLLLFYYSFFMTSLSFMIKISITVIPFLFVGWISNIEEKKVLKRDQMFPPFIRSLGDVQESKGGTLTTTIETLLPHNFGILNGMLIRVYKRLKITADKFTSWFYFSKESGSALVNEFIDIFVSVVYRGGSPSKAGRIISDNMVEINGLRDMRREFVSTLRGSVYGSFFGLALTLYISLFVSVMLFKVFGNITKNLGGMAFQLVSGILPTGMENTFGISHLYIGIILVIHAFLSSIIVKKTDGGNYFGAFFDFVLMVWLGALMEFVVSIMFKSMFGSYI